MSGRMNNNRENRRGFLMVPVALQIFLILSLLVVLTGIGAYQIQYKGYQDYELENYHEMMEDAGDREWLSLVLKGLPVMRDYKDGVILGIE